MRTFAGDGNACVPVTDVALPLVGLCPAGGLAASPDGLSVYYGDGSVGISRAARVGTAYWYAGKYTGFATYGDGPKFDVTVSPRDVAYDPVSGNVYFIDVHAVRAVTPAGQVTTIAGTTADCNSPSDDTTPAIGACLWPYHLAVQGGRVYFTEQSSWNGPRARYVDGNTLHTIAGNSTRSEPTLGGPATASGFPDMGGITVDAQGNVYLSGLSRGRIWRVAAADQTLSLTTEFQGGAGFMATDLVGNLYVALPYLQQIAKISGLVQVVPDQYQALGDSYSSGEGAPAPSGYLLGTDLPTDKCHRSGVSYPFLDYALPGMPTKFGFHACSGAIIEDFFTPFSTNHAAGDHNPDESVGQLDWLGAQTKVVTLTVGGNNLQFPTVMDWCARRGPFQKSCEKQFGGVVDSSLVNIGIGTGRGHDNLPDLYASIRAKAPNATVYILGYPKIFPSKVPTICLTSRTLPVRFFLPSDMQWINSKIGQLNALMKDKASAAGFKYVDESSALVGHELCTSKPWINSGRPFNAHESFHPNVSGQASMASILAGSLQA
jgi:hypothetical protein